MPESMIIGADAQELKAEVLRLADEPMAIKACISAAQALGEYSGQRIIFGRPDMVARALPEMPAVDWVQSTWAGVEPLVTLGRRDYSLTVIKGIFGPQMSEYVFAHLLAHELKLPERQQHQREHHWFKAQSGSLDGRRLGIMGTGSIGRHIAKTARAFGMTVLGLSRSGAPAEGFASVVPVKQIDRFLDGIDYLVSALPGTPETDHLLDAAALSRLPGHAFLVNIGRSNVIDDGALIDALGHGRLAGAAMDVFDQEPVPPDSPLWDTPNLSMTAHVAAVSHPSLIAPIFMDNYRRYTTGQPLRYTFNFAKGY